MRLIHSKAFYRTPRCRWLHWPVLVLLIAPAQLALSGVQNTEGSRDRNTQEKKPVRKVEVTLLGPVDMVKGVDWPVDADGKRDYSVWVVEPCDLTIHLRDRDLRLDTRPILILVQTNGTVMSIHAPTAAKKASIREKVEEVDRILAEWKARPSERMRKALDDWWQRNPPGQTASVIVPDLRAGRASLDDRCDLSARFLSPSDGGWNVVIEVSATLKEWDRVRGRKQAHEPTDK